MIKKKEKREVVLHDEVNERLRAIYGNDTRDLHVVEQSSQSWSSFFAKAVGGLVAIAVLALGGFLVYTNILFGGNTEETLELNFDVPAEITSGTVTDIVLNYKNIGNRQLAQLSYEVRLPVGFSPELFTPEPTDPEHLIWNIGAFGRGSDGKIIIRGMYVGEVGKTATVQAVATYRPGNFNADFTKISSATIPVTDSVVTLAAEGPHDATAGAENEYIFTIGVADLDSDHPIPPITLSLLLPTGFSITTSEPPLTPGSSSEWLLDNLGGESEKRIIKIRGVYTNDVADVAQIQAAASFMTVSDLGGQSQVMQAVATAATNVAKNPLQVAVVVNGTSRNADVTLGGIASLTVEVVNTGMETVEPTKLLLDFQPEQGIPIVWGEANLDGGKLTAQGVLFGENILGTLAAGERKLLHLSFPVKNTKETEGVESFSVLAHIAVGGAEFTASPVQIRLIGSLETASSAIFYDTNGGPLGEGPLPPRSGLATTYVVKWTAKSTLHATENITLSATLPVGVAFGGQRDIDDGEVQYDESTRVVRWAVDRLEADVPRTANFAIIVTPEDADVDTFMKILGVTAGKAIDAITGSFISSSDEALTTELDGQDGSGVVAQ